MYHKVNKCVLIPVALLDLRRPASALMGLLVRPICLLGLQLGIPKLVLIQLNGSFCHNNCQLNINCVYYLARLCSCM